MITFLFFITALLVLSIFYYNNLIRKKNEVDNAMGSISTMLKNRYDLIPNLVDTVKSYMTYEADMLNKLTSLRTMALQPNVSELEQEKLTKDIGVLMKKIIVSVENYPELKTSTNFLQLQESWTEIEDRISASRRFYNNGVVEYNIAIRSFPQNIIAKMMRYQPKKVFELTAEEAQNIWAKNLFNNDLK